MQRKIKNKRHQKVCRIMSFHTKDFYNGGDTVLRNACIKYISDLMTFSRTDDEY